MSIGVDQQVPADVSLPPRPPVFSGYLWGILRITIGVRLAGIGGAVLVAFMYLAGFVWPENNPFVDEHILEIILLVSFALVGAGRWLGFGNRWAKTRLVKRYPVLL